jgi:hypothetical protein
VLRKYGLLGGVMTLLLGFGLMSCEGDLGPVGPAGTEGPAGDEGAIGPEGPPGSGVGFHNTPTPGFGSGLTFVTAASVDFDVTETQSLVYFQADVGVWGDGTPCKAGIRLTFDGVADDLTLVHSDVPVSNLGNNMGVLMTSTMKTFSQGTHTVTLEQGGWAGNCGIYKHPHLNVIVLGN